MPKKFLIFFEKSHSAENESFHIFIHWDELPNAIAYLNTLTRLHILIHAILIHWVGFRLSAPYLNTLPTRLGNTLGSRLSAPYLNTLPTRLGNTLGSRLHILIHCRFGSQSESSTLGSRQNRTLRQPSRQPIRIEYYVTRVVSQSESSITSSLRHPRALGSGGRPFSALGSSRLAIAYLNTLGSSTPLRWSAHTLTTIVSQAVSKFRKMAEQDVLHSANWIFSIIDQIASEVLLRDRKPNWFLRKKLTKNVHCSCLILCQISPEIAKSMKYIASSEKWKYLRKIHQIRKNSSIE